VERDAAQALRHVLRRRKDERRGEGKGGRGADLHGRAVTKNGPKRRRERKVAPLEGCHAKERKEKEGVAETKKLASPLSGQGCALEGRKEEKRKKKKQKP